ncbi:MAG TPA: peptidyl-tRNA hydrolase [Candidatus Poseidoniales archaeon]|jgi:PTH2 family peptidyl-tRNA hydrolase|nr:MAG: aminoacyl-tRNA hydrolase [Euryarchaeota archaeon]HIG03618.1 peptidyl-tRNA hydrolase [Candidatus Poseidoniales archaeon]HIK78254.1 peptidyl-tRNA hydrolase [Candidatus Poseidoniales archaeon]
MGIRSLLHQLTTPPPQNTFQNCPTEELKLICIVNQSLKMGKGKIAAQVAHAAVKATLSKSANTSGRIESWLRSGQAKVVVKAPDSQTLAELETQATSSSLPVSIVVDAGRTQIPSGSLTVIAIGPASSIELEDITGKLKLL